MRLPKFIRDILAPEPDHFANYMASMPVEDRLPVIRPVFVEVPEALDEPAYVRNFRKTREQRSEEAKRGHMKRKANASHRAFVPSGSSPQAVSPVPASITFAKGTRA